jgi:hypothetical protein
MSVATAPPVTLSIADDLERSRVLVLFRLPLAIPHLVWFYLWTYAAMLVGLVSWVSALVIGRPPRLFFRFLSAYVRYQTHFWAFVTLVGNPFPGFVGQPGSYPIDLHLPAEPQTQRRLVIFFRVLLVLPAFAVYSVLTYAQYLVAFLGWWVALVLGRMPEGFRDLGAYILRYAGAVNAYLYLLTERYPNASPRLGFSNSVDE